MFWIFGDKLEYMVTNFALVLGTVVQYYIPEKSIV